MPTSAPNYIIVESVPYPAFPTIFQFIGMTGTVHYVEDDGDLLINYMSNAMFHINPEAVTKVWKFSKAQWTPILSATVTLWLHRWRYAWSKWGMWCVF